MWKNYYDNELTITALYHHIRLVVQMQRELEQNSGLQTKLQELQKKIYYQTQEHKKELKNVQANKIGKKVEQIFTVSEEETELKKIVEELEKNRENASKELFKQFSRKHMNKHT